MVPSGLPAHSLTPATSFPKNLPIRYLLAESESSAKGQSEAGLALKQDMCPVHGQCLTDWACVADVRVASRWPNAGLQLSGHLRRKDTRPAFEAETMYWGLVYAKVSPEEVPVVAVAAEGFAAASRAMGG